MAILIKDPETDRLIRQLAERTGETITATVKAAIIERLKRTPLTPGQLEERRRKIKEWLQRVDAQPIEDGRSPEEIVGYNKHGVFDR